MPAWLSWHTGFDEYPHPSPDPRNNCYLSVWDSSTLYFWKKQDQCWFQTDLCWWVYKRVRLTVTVLKICFPYTAQDDLELLDSMDALASACWVAGISARTTTLAHVWFLVSGAHLGLWVVATTLSNKSWVDNEKTKVLVIKISSVFLKKMMYTFISLLPSHLNILILHNKKCKQKLGNRHFQWSHFLPLRTSERNSLTNFYSWRN